MYIRSVLIFSFILIFVQVVRCQASNLVFVNVIYRHGDRTPIESYPTDPYKDPKYWPDGWGQLTNKGKQQHYALGQWLRERYANFLPSIYSLQDIYVRSTDVDRTLMSAESNLAGLYPPVGRNIWDPDVHWQAIPVHTVPEKEDAVLAAKKRCPRYDVELYKLLETEEFIEMQKEMKPLMTYLSNYTGKDVSNIQDLEYIYNTLFIESLNNLKLPDWTKEVFPDKMKPWAEFSFKIYCYSTRLQRLKTGLLLNEIMSRFIKKIENNLIPNRRMWMYSAHDTTIANVLMSLGAFDSHSPPYASTILIELSRQNKNYFVSVFYKNGSDAYPVSILGCDFMCPLNRSMKLLNPILLNSQQWDLECRSLSAPMVSTIAAVAVISCGVLLLLLLISLCVGATFGRKQKNRNQFYQPLNDQIN